MNKRILIIGLLLGFILGFAGGCLFYSAVLDKPEVVIKKQKVKGRGNSAEFNNQIPVKDGK
jgi:hypothetical protein